MNADGTKIVRLRFWLLQSLTRACGFDIVGDRKEQYFTLHVKG